MLFHEMGTMIANLTPFKKVHGSTCRQAFQRLRHLPGLTSDCTTSDWPLSQALLKAPAFPNALLKATFLASFLPLWDSVTSFRPFLKAYPLLSYLNCPCYIDIFLTRKIVQIYGACTTRLHETHKHLSMQTKSGIRSGW